MTRTALRLTALCLALTTPAGAAPTLDKCRTGIADAGRKYFQARYEAQRRCEDVLTVGCAPTDPAVSPDLARAESALQSRLAARCTDALVAGLIFGVPCTGAATLATLSDCIVDDAHGANADNLILTAYDSVGTIADAGIRRCQSTIGKESGKYATARLKQRANCAKKQAREIAVGREPRRCPDLATQRALDHARDRILTRIDQRCTDAQVLDPALDFGFPCDAFAITTFDRDGVTNNNAMAARLRLARCVAAAAAGDGDLGAATVLPGSDRAGFSFGVASGDATPTSAMLWTRTDGPGAVTVAVHDATTNALAFSQSGLTPNAAGDNSVHIDVSGLSPDTAYTYQFTQGGASSRTGRVRTAPLPASTNGLTFAWTGDANAFFKPYTVLEGVLRDDPDLWLFIGDTIYGDDPRSGTGVAAVRADYHTKYEENRGDPALRDVMANISTLTIWDDHEVTNDFYGTNPATAAQMAEGNQAMRDWMPIRENGGDPMQLYRSFQWGQAAEFFLIDSRQYRSSQAYVTEPACLDAGQPATLPGPACLAEIANPGRTYLGTAQKAWLKSGLLASTATFKFVMNGPLLTELDFVPYDRWEGYAAEREEMLEFIEANGIPNVIFLSTDIHAAIVNDAVVNPGPSGGSSVRELVSGAIGMDPIFRELPAAILPFVSSLPGLFTTISYFDIDRFNYAVVQVTPAQAQVTYRDNTGGILKSLTIPAAP